MRNGSSKRLAVLRESIGKTVRMFTQEGIKVTQRGTQPFVLWNPTTGKAERINMPMIPEDAELELLEALQGFLDHECAHVFFTPAQQQITVAASGRRSLLPMMNLVEDIRIEKLLPLKYPGTAANLSRMRSGAFGTILKKICDKALLEPQPQQAISMMVPAFRALAGQPEMQQLMDEGGYWPGVQPLIDKLPNLAHRLQTMLTYDEVIEIAQWIFDTLGKPKIAPTPFDEPPAPGEDEGDEPGASASVEAEPQDTDEPGDSPPDEDLPQETDPEKQGEGEPDDSDADADDADADSDEPGEGEGSPDGGDGDGEDGDEGEGDEGSGDADAADDDAEGDGAAGDNDDEGNSSEGDEADSGDEGSDDDGDEGTATQPSDDDETAEGKTGKGKSKHSVTEAMKKLSPTHRQVLFMYNKKRLDVATIVSKMKISEDDVRQALQAARRNLGRLMQEDKL